MRQRHTTRKEASGTVVAPSEHDDFADGTSQEPHCRNNLGRALGYSMTTGLVFDIQRFAIHDGPGIRTLVFLKGCPLRCLWCDNPESQRSSPEMAFFDSNCIRCGSCLRACAVNAIHGDNGGFAIDREICNSCGKCTEVCYPNAKKLIGRVMTTDEVLNEVKKDMVFYRNSASDRSSGGECGGVTVSGGEPLMQSDFVVELLRRCGHIDIHTTMETSGYAKYENLERTSQYVDFLYFDIKHMDPVSHQRLTGVSNEKILENALRISHERAHSSKRTIVRVPLIPAHNDSESNIEATAQFVRELRSVDRIEFLPYHRFGEGKYKQLGRKYDLEHLVPPSKEHVERLRRIIESHNLHVQIGG